MDYVDRAALRDWSKLFPLLLATPDWSWRPFSAGTDSSSHLLQKVYVYEPQKQHFASPAEVVLFLRESNRRHSVGEDDDDSSSSSSSNGSTSDSDDCDISPTECSIDNGTCSSSCAQRVSAIEAILCANRFSNRLLSGISIFLSNIGEEEEGEVKRLVRANGGTLLLRLLPEHAKQDTIVVSSAVGHRRLAYIQALSTGVPIVHPLWVLRGLKQGSGGSSSSRRGSGSGMSNYEGGAAREPYLPLEGYLLSRAHAWRPNEVHPHSPSSSSSDGFLEGMGIINATGKQLWTNAMFLHGAYVCTINRSSQGTPCTDLSAVALAAASMRREHRSVDLVVVDSEDVFDVGDTPFPGRSGGLRMLGGSSLFIDLGLWEGRGGRDLAPPEEEETLSSSDEDSAAPSFSGEEEEEDSLCGAGAYSRLVRVVTEEWLSSSLLLGAATDPDSSDLYRPCTDPFRMLTFRACKDRVALHDVLRYGGGDIGLVAGLTRLHRHAVEVQCTILPLVRLEDDKGLRLGAGPLRILEPSAMGARVLLLDERVYRACAFASGDRDVYFIGREHQEEVRRALSL